MTIPSPPVDVSCSHHADASATAASSDRSTRRYGVATNQPASAAQLGDRLHVPNVGLFETTAPSVARTWKWRKLDVVKSGDRPAVVAIGIGEPLGQSAALLITLDKFVADDTPLGGDAQCVQHISQRAAGRCANCRVLLLDELLRLGRPRHDLAVEAHPVGG